MTKQQEELLLRIVFAIIAGPAIGLLVLIPGLIFYKLGEWFGVGGVYLYIAIFVSLSFFYNPNENNKV